MKLFGLACLVGLAEGSSCEMNIQVQFEVPAADCNNAAAVAAAKAVCEEQDVNHLWDEMGPCRYILNCQKTCSQPAVDVKPKGTGKGTPTMGKGKPKGKGKRRGKGKRKGNGKGKGKGQRTGKGKKKSKGKGKGKNEPSAPEGRDCPASWGLSCPTLTCPMGRILVPAQDAATGGEYYCETCDCHEAPFHTDNPPEEPAVEDLSVNSFGYDPYFWEGQACGGTELQYYARVIGAPTECAPGLTCTKAMDANRPLFRLACEMPYWTTPTLSAEGWACSTTYPYRGCSAGMECVLDPNCMLMLLTGACPEKCAPGPAPTPAPVPAASNPWTHDLMMGWLAQTEVPAGCSNHHHCRGTSPQYCFTCPAECRSSVLSPYLKAFCGTCSVAAAVGSCGPAENCLKDNDSITGECPALPCPILNCVGPSGAFKPTDCSWGVQTDDNGCDTCDCVIPTWLFGGAPPTR